MQNIRFEYTISLLALAVSLSTLWYLIVQVRAYTKQLKLDSLIKISEINREILSLGFSDSELFDILENDATENTKKAKRYYQLWLNQIDIIWHAQKYDLFDADDNESIRTDIADLFMLGGMRSHWDSVSKYYSKGLCKYIDGILSDSALQTMQKREFIHLFK